MLDNLIIYSIFYYYLSFICEKEIKKESKLINLIVYIIIKVIKKSQKIYYIL